MASLFLSGDLSDDGKEKIDTDVEIYNQRVLLVLDKTIQRVKLSSLLLCPSKQSELSGKIPDATEEVILGIRKRYEEMTPKISYGSNEAQELSAEAQRRIIDHELSKVILILENDFNLREMVDSMKTVEGSETLNLMIKCLEELRKGVESHQKENEAQEKVREKHLRRCQLKNEEAKKEIDALVEELVVKKRELNANIIGKNLLIHRYETKMEKIQKVTREAIERRIMESEAAIQAAAEASQEAQAVMTEKLSAGKIKYEAMLQDHLSKEKQLREQRLRIENQLVAWMQKYDQDMFERQAEEEELQGTYEAEKREYDEIQRKLDEQEEEYDELMQEKAAYEQEVLEQKLFIFILNRSARRIQRAFRAYRIHKLTKKKKGKKGKGKKK